MAGLQKNVAGQSWLVFAYEDGGGTTPGAPVPGDAANITAKIRKDSAAAAATDDVNPTEIEDGYYEFDVTQAEVNADVLDILPESATANVQVIGVPGRIFTEAAGYNAKAVDDLTDFDPTTDEVDADVVKIAGKTLPAEVLARTHYGLHDDAYVVVADAATDAARGTELANAYTAAKALTPGGTALSATNRATVLIPLGHYELSSSLAIDTEYVDFAALVPERGTLPANWQPGNHLQAGDFEGHATLIYGSTASDNTGLFEQTADDVRLTGFALDNTAAAGAGRDALTIKSTDNSASIYTDMTFWQTGDSGGGARSHGTSDFGGTWVGCIAIGLSFRPITGCTGDFTAQMKDCTAGSNSFGGDSGGGAVGAYCERCYGGPASFCSCAIFGTPIDSNSTFVECWAGNSSYALGKECGGTFIRCRGGALSFGSTVSDGATTKGSFTGYAEDCVGGGGSFGGAFSSNTGDKCTGTLVNCICRGNYESLRLESATIEDCVFTAGYTDTDCFTLLDSGSRIHNSTLLVVDGGTGIPISAATAQTVSAVGNRYNNGDNDADGLGANVTNTGVVPNDLSVAEVDAEVDEAIENYGLDHLVGAAVTGTDITNDSIIAQLVSASAIADWDDFVNTTDSLQAVRDRGDSAWATATGFSTHGDPGPDIAALNDLSAAQVDAEVDEAIENYGLDHLVMTAVTGTDVTDDSIIAQIVSASVTADWDDFVNTTDSLQALRDEGDSAWITATGFSTHGDPTSGLQTYGDANWATATGFMPSTEDGSSFTEIPWNASWDSEVQSEVTDALKAYDPPTHTELTAALNNLNDPDAAAVANAVLAAAISAQGEDVQAVLKVMFAWARGKVEEIGSDYAYYDDDGITVLFTNSFTDDSRTPN